MQAKDVIARVRILLRDETSQDRWTDPELFLYLQDGVDAIGNVKPAETVQYITLPLTGSNRQSLPVKYRQLVRLEQNETGKRINKADRYALSVCEYLYSQYDHAREVLDYWQDDAANREFWVYPKPRAGVQVEGYLSVYQPAITGFDDELSITEAYRSALVDYVVSSAFGKDAEYADNARIASLYAESFFNKTGISIKGRADPKTTEYDRRKAKDD